MSNRIDLTRFIALADKMAAAHDKMGLEGMGIHHAEAHSALLEAIDELKRCYEELDKADEAMLKAREVLMKHHEWMSMNDATSEEDDQEILDVVKALREASE